MTSHVMLHLHVPQSHRWPSLACVMLIARCPKVDEADNMLQTFAVSSNPTRRHTACRPRRTGAMPQSPLPLPALLRTKLWKIGKSSWRRSPLCNPYGATILQWMARAAALWAVGRPLRGHVQRRWQGHQLSRWSVRSRSTWSCHWMDSW